MIVIGPAWSANSDWSGKDLPKSVPMLLGTLVARIVSTFIIDRMVQPS